MYYEISGEGRPILMLHGFYPDHRLMTGCLEPIFQRRPGWQRIYLDLPGMGQTPAEEWIDSFTFTGRCKFCSERVSRPGLGWMVLKSGLFPRITLRERTR